MNLEFVAKNTEINDTLRAFAEKQLMKVVRFLEEPIDIRVRLEEKKKHQQIADLHISHRFGVIQATDETGDLRDAIRLAVDKAKKQAKRSRKKAKDRKRRAIKVMPFEWPVDILDPATLQAKEGPTVIESRTFHLQPMDVEGAVAKMKEVGLGFYVYRDTVTSRVNILYTRNDGTLGLLSPEI